MYTKRVDAGGLRRRGDVQRAPVVDLAGHVRRELAERIVRELGHVHDGVDTRRNRLGRGGGCPYDDSTVTVGASYSRPAR